MTQIKMDSSVSPNLLEMFVVMVRSCYFKAQTDLFVVSFLWYPCFVSPMPF